MTAPVRGGASDSLRQLRVRLTFWYAATFVAILAMLGVGLLMVIRNQYSDDLDLSLANATREIARAAQIREMESKSARGAVVDAVEELRIPGRSLFLLDSAARPVIPSSAESWIVDAARRAHTGSATSVDHTLEPERVLRVHAERFRLESGTEMIAAATADMVELEDRYAGLIAAFGGAAAVALLLVAIGGWVLMRKSTEPAELAMDRMRRFMADAAHELRTPLTVLRTRAEVTLQQSRSSDEYGSALRAIDDEAGRMARIVDDLMTLARADAGDRPVARERVYVDDIALSAAEAARPLAAARGVRLDVDEFEEARTKGDAELIRRLAMILLDNAIKFTPSGGSVHLSVGVTAGRPTLTVRDTGTGIAVADLPLVYDRFFRGNTARTRGSNGDSSGHSGAGLGLSIARWIVDAHGASIDIQSPPEKGTSVTVAFPADSGPPLSSS